jgi:hypothetical protein
MAAVNGTLYGFFSAAGTISTAVASTDKIYSCKNATLNVDVDLPDASTKESGGWAQHITGIKKASVSFDGVWDEAGTATTLTIAEILALIIAGNTQRKFAFVPAALGTTIPGWKFMGSFKNITIGSDMENPCTFSGSVESSGALVLFDS